MTIDLVRENHQSFHRETLGWLKVGDEIFCTLELPWRNNARGISCIQPGEYTTRYLRSSASGKYKRVYHVTGTPGRAGILIHTGNISRHSRGCILIGMRHGIFSGERAVLASRIALSRLRSIVGQKTFLLNITYA